MTKDDVSFQMQNKRFKCIKLSVHHTTCHNLIPAVHLLYNTLQANLHLYLVFQRCTTFKTRTNKSNISQIRFQTLYFVLQERTWNVVFVIPSLSTFYITNPIQHHIPNTQSIITLDIIFYLKYERTLNVGMYNTSSRPIQGLLNLLQLSKFL